MITEQAIRLLELTTYIVVGIVGVWIVFQLYLSTRRGL